MIENEIHDFVVDGLRIEGGVARTEDPDAVVVLCHGLPSGQRRAPGDQGYASTAEAFASRGYEAWWFNFRGAYGSEGVFTLGGWMNDLHAVISEVSRSDLPVFLVGSSAGGAVALGVAAESTAVAGVATLAATAYWRKERPGGDLLSEARRLGLVPDGFATGIREADAWWAEFETNRSEWAVPLMGGRPLLIVHGDEDNLVPLSHAEALFAAANEPKELVVIPGAGHQLRRDPRALEAVLDWMDRVVSKVPVWARDAGPSRPKG